ncbi:DUF922 domain-containing protein [Maribacter sp. ACAM166]|nr:DUF922 domain-containing protein [Maribacter sp. ACAM166]
MQSQKGVQWRPDVRLSWEDFIGTDPVGSSAAATTASGISYNFETFYEGDERKVHFNVHTYFYPEQSWYKPKFCNEMTLLHEQLHFDITELYARKLREQLANTKFSENIKEEVRKIYKVIIRQLNDFQNKYDSETDYSRNLTVQERWLDEIESALIE